MADEVQQKIVIAAKVAPEVDKAALSKTQKELSKALSQASSQAKYQNALQGVKGVLGGAASITGVKKLGDTVKTTTAHFNNFIHAIGRIAIYRAIRSAIKGVTQGFQEGIQNAYQWSVVTGNQFARSMDMMATSALYLKNSLGAMTMPLINYLAPILDRITDQFVNLINVVNRFIATITGASSWTKALKYPAQYMEQAAGSAKELKNQLLGFDELNILNAPNGGGGGAALDYSRMFENVTLSATKFSKALKEAIKKGDWKGVGKLFSDKFNEMVANLNTIDLANILGEKINNVISLVHTLLNETDFKQVGVKIGQFMSNLKLDWGSIAQSWIRWHTNILDALIGLIQGVNWANVGHSLGEFIKGLFNGISGWLREVNWRQLATDVWTALRDMFASVDWWGIAQAIFGVLSSALSAAWSWISESFRTLIRIFTGEVSASQIYNAAASTSGAYSYSGSSGGRGRGADPMDRLTYASGGFPTQGSMFIAGENGAEFVGQIGGRTGVYNTDQMATALASANEGVVEAVTAMATAVVSAINRKDTSLNINDVRRALNSSNLRYGV